MSIQKYLEKIFNNPIVVFMGIQVFAPRPGTPFDFFLELSLVSLYSLTYLTWQQNTIGVENLKTNFVESYNKFKFEINILFIVFVYEFFLLVFIQPNSVSNLSFTLRPIYLITILMFGYSIGKYDNKLIENTLSFIYIMLLINYLVSILQYYDINFVSYIYNDIKAFPKGRLVRLTGLYSNPNEFAWRVAQYTLFIVIFEDKKYRVYFSLALSFLFVLLSGSRSILMLMPLMMVFPILFQNLFVHKSIKMIIKTLVYTVMGFVFIVIVLIKFKHKLPYISQILKVFEGGLRSVNSFDLRLQAWERVINTLRSNIYNVIFGIRDASYGSVDNDFLYIWYRSGIVGLLLQQIIQIFMLVRILKSKQFNKVKIYFITLLVFSIIVGFQADTLSGWLFFPYIILFYGLSFVDEKSKSN